MVTCLIVQHIDPEGPFAIGSALADAGIEIDLRRPLAGDALPDDIAAFDGLVVMGGPMSAASDEGFACRNQELALLRAAVADSVPTLGVCLGAQLLAAAVGAKVYPGTIGPEIGWSPVTLLPSCGDDPLFSGLGDSLNVLQWHGDTFDLPSDAVHLMSNDRYSAQGFRLGRCAWGLQFHLEVDQGAVEGFVAAFTHDLAHADGGGDAITAQTPGALAQLDGPRSSVLNRFATLVGARSGRQLVHEG